MADFNSFAYGLCLMSTLISLAVYWLLERAKRRPTGWTQTNSEFRSFQLNFLCGYLPCLFADSLQAPYLYYLYQSYGFLESQIAILYVTGFATNVVCSVVSVHLVQRYERRVLCLAFVGMNSISCLIKFSDSYTLLMAGRVMDGFAASLLTMPFHQWYVHEHVTTFDFPKEWIGSTFRRVAVLSGFLSVAAGFVAEFSESTFRITAFPFLIAIPVLIAGGFYMARGWSENRLDPDLRPAFWSQWSRALRTIGQRPIVFLLSAVQSLFESTIYMFVFLWTPLFLSLKPLMVDRPSFGGIYSALMASALLGTMVQRVLARRFSAAHIVCGAAAIALTAMGLSVALIYPGESSVAHFKVLLASLCSFELAVGLYFPAMQKLQKDVLPADDRAAIVGLLRVPLNVMAAAGLLVLHSRDRVYGNWSIIVICTLLLALCLLASLLLMGLVNRRRPDLDHFVLKLNADNDSEEEEVFS